MAQYVSQFFIFLAGFIDSIAGGGGLISVPVMTFLVGPGAQAIATNKILGVVSACTALVVYMRKGHLQLHGSKWFLLALGVGTLAGAKLAIIMPLFLFKWFLLAACPVILFITLRRDSFISREAHVASPWLLATLGFTCGLYDGAFGPGGGTFMFLSLSSWGGFPLLAAIATSKLANTLSAGVSLASFAMDGQVVWSIGLPLASFSIAGALLGSHFASARAKQVVRPVLIVVVLLLLARLYTEF